jgi:hypothetical protein
MKEGFIVKKIDKRIHYWGIDACNSNEEYWEHLNEWNVNNPNDSIFLDSGTIIFKDKYSPSLHKYLEWLRHFKKINDVCLLYFSTPFQKSMEAFPLNSFDFLGYDCGYIEDEYSESILFSSISNEMYSKSNDFLFFSFLKDVNNNELFNSLETAKEYLNIRSEALENNKGNLETAWKDLNPEILKVYMCRI